MEDHITREQIIPKKHAKYLEKQGTQLLYAITGMGGPTTQESNGNPATSQGTRNFG